jgi:hypothetical protein
MIWCHGGSVAPLTMEAVIQAAAEVEGMKRYLEGGKEAQSDRKLQLSAQLLGSFRGVLPLCHSAIHKGELYGSILLTDEGRHLSPSQKC